MSLQLGPTRTASIVGKRNAFLIINYYSRFTWVMFLSIKMILYRILKFSMKTFKETKITISQN